MNHSSRSLKRSVASAAVCALSIAAFSLAGCRGRSGLPGRNTAAYRQYVSTFYVGLSALQVGDDVLADTDLKKATEIAPGEPAAWVDWGILALRQRDFTPAQQRFEKARKLIPHNSRVYYLLGLLYTARGDTQHAIHEYKEAVKLDPKNLQATYSLARAIEREGGAGSDGEYQKLIQTILAEKPDNLAALVELSRIAAKRGDAATLHSAVQRIAAQGEAWPAEAKQQLTALESAASSSAPRSAALQSVFLRNALMQVAAFREDLSVIRPAPGNDAQPFTRMVKLPNPSSTPAPADTGIHFISQPVPGIGAGDGKTKWSWIGAVSLDGEGAPTVMVANGHEVRLATGASFAFPGGPKALAPRPEGILGLDYNYDFKMDLALAGAGGFRLMRQNSPTSFTNVTAATKLPRSVLDASYTGAWAVDIDADGNMDIVLGQKAGLPTVLRNNGDGTFTAIHPFGGISGIEQFVWADLTGNGSPDAAIIDGTGHLHLFMNERLGKFVQVALPSEFAEAKAIAAAGVNVDGEMNLVAVLPDGTIARLTVKGNGQRWKWAKIATVPDSTANLAGPIRLLATDIDNNGAPDLLVAQVSPSADRNAGGLIWLAHRSGKFILLGHPVGPSEVFQLADVEDNGRMALLGITTKGQAREELNQGTKGYHWQTIRPRARRVTGSQRVNTFGIGGTVEIRSGLMTQELPIAGPQLHFGLGTQTQAEVARITWPNGTVNAEFSLKADEVVLAEQRLKGSCPYLFAWNGKKMKFVMDTAPWGAAIGLRINGQGPAVVEKTSEWYKIPHGELVSRDDFYDMDITDELWETYYYDYLSLMVVDHPKGTEIYTDERFVAPPKEPAIVATGKPHSIERAVDNNGNDVTKTLLYLDGKYLANFKASRYPGITSYHYVDIYLGKDIPTTSPLYLIAKGWLDPDNSTVNAAIRHDPHEKLEPLSLSVEDSHGVWRVVRPNLGFPSGRNKTCVFNLTGIFHPGDPHVVRLGTNMEIYWDQIEWARGLPDTPLKIMHLSPVYANLHYRGYSVIDKANASSPEIPEYNHLMATTQIWEDLRGYYTRYGNVRPLLMKVDDRYVIMNAGDELSLRFAEPAPPPAGWVRDYVFAGDGWTKDGDYNTVDSATVRPLPYHARKIYDTPPKPLEDEWEYRHHRMDWEKYQTRYITPRKFEDALRSTPSQ